MANIPFISECYKIVKGMRNRTVLTLDGEFYSKNTIINISSKIKNNFIKYEENLGGTIMCDDICYQWTEDYRLYLLNNGYSKNSISNILSILKALIRRLKIQGMVNYYGEGMRVSSEVTTAVFNSVDELKLLYNIDLSEYKGKERVRDIYVLQCFMGVRVGDMFKFMKEIQKSIKTVSGIKFIEIKTNKTGEIVCIPLSKIALKILEKYNYNFGVPFSQQYYSKALKEIYINSGLDREILFYRTEGGEKIERSMLFSDLLGTHSARRSFATNAYLKGLNPLDIMKITGHKTFSAFTRYIRCENLAVAVRISDHEFFNLEL